MKYVHSVKQCTIYVTKCLEVTAGIRFILRYVVWIITRHECMFELTEPVAHKFVYVAGKHPARR